MHGKFLILLVFISGLVVLGAELSASRLLAPFFGTSLPVWTSLIGLILICIAIGNWIGGRLADRSPHLRTLLHFCFAGAVLIALVPMLSKPVLAIATQQFNQMNVGMLVGSFIGVALLLGLPMILLGCVTPFAVRIATDDVQAAGRIAGRIFAASTIGSFVGCFLPVLILIPTYGTRWTFILLGSLLILTAAAGYVRLGRIR
ncbi:MAG: fused MFS/spermidine synthase, partial [Verrucomicrobiota bacterium]